MHVTFSGHAIARREGHACEDAWAARERDGVLVAALADGVGSSREGGAAAHRAVDMLVEYCLARPRAWSPRRALAEFTNQINRQLHSEAQATHGSPELACTLSAVILEGTRLYGCNVGDSPVYLWRRGRLSRLTEAHALTEAGLEHVLTRALGLEARVEPFFFESDLCEHDIVLLCSDGVSEVLPGERLSELLSRRATARTLTQTARQATDERAELRDDVSAIVLEVADLRDAHTAARQRLEVLPTLKPQQNVDGFVLKRPLADNERVWLAGDENGRNVVLKFPPRDAADTEPLRDAFVREAWNATRLTSPDLVRAWTPDTPTLHCYAMEYIDAPTLAHVLARGRLSVDDALALGTFLVRVAAFLLTHDLAHGDIKPENIVVCRGAAISFRLLDLGSASELFSTRSRAGTATYLAPERFRGAAVSERTEIYAIGVTLYQALTGSFPFGEIERFQTPRFETPPRLPSRINTAVPPWLEAVVLRAIEPDPNRRYQHFSEIAYDLEHPQAVAAHHRKDAPLIERNPLLFWKLLCAVLALVCLALTWLLARK